MMMHSEVAPGRHVYRQSETPVAHVKIKRIVKIDITPYMTKPRTTTEIANHFGVSVACTYRQTTTLVNKGTVEFTSLPGSGSRRIYRRAK